MYRELKSNETVIDGDEVLSEFGEKYWTKYHGYYGEKVKDCKGYMTGNQRIFRRIKIVKNN